MIKQTTQQLLILEQEINTLITQTKSEKESSYSRIKQNQLGYLNNRLLSLMKSSRYQQNEIKEKLTSLYEHEIVTSLFLLIIINF